MQFGSLPAQNIREDFISDSDYITPKGQFRGMGQRQKADGKGGWVDVNIVHSSQPAVLNGQNVRADGKGNWVNMAGKVVGTYKVGEDRGAAPSKPTPVGEPPKPDTRLGSVDTPTPYPTEAITKPVPRKPPVVPTGRDTPPPDGSPAKGTSMGSSVLQMDEVDKILNGRGLPSLADPFSSNNLPGIDYSTEDAAAFGRDSQESKAIATGGFVETTFDGDKPPISVLQREGSPEIVQDGEVSADVAGSAAVTPDSLSIPKRPSSARQAERWDHKYGSMAQPVEREISDLERGYNPDLERRRAFLDADNSMDGLRAVEAQKGVFHTAGQSFVVDPNNDGQMMAIDQDDRQTLMGRDEQKAQDLLGSYVKAIKEDEEETAM